MPQIISKIKDNFQVVKKFHFFVNIPVLFRKQISEKKSELKKKENLYYAVRTDR